MVVISILKVGPIEDLIKQSLKYYYLLILSGFLSIKTLVIDFKF